MHWTTKKKNKMKNLCWKCCGRTKIKDPAEPFWKFWKLIECPVCLGTGAALNLWGYVPDKPTPSPIPPPKIYNCRCEVIKLKHENYFKGGKMGIELKSELSYGQEVTDSMSGFTGKVVAITQWQHGCVRVAVQGKVDKDGKRREAEWFDEPQLTGKETKGAHGPRPDAVRHPDA